MTKSFIAIAKVKHAFRKIW